LGPLEHQYPTTPCHDYLIIKLLRVGQSLQEIGHKKIKTHNPSILMLQETLMDGERASKILSLALPGWDFIGSNAQG